MNRRTFVSMCAAATVGSAFCKSAQVLAAPPGDKPFAGAKLRMSAPLDWFPGDKPEDKLDHVAAWGLPA